VRARFLSRPNRFIAEVVIDGEAGTETVHVKNTGRCKELLIPGCEVWLALSDDPRRRTRYDLVTVRKQNGLLVNIDSQAPNKVAAEWLSGQDFDRVIPEHTCGNSRIDFYMERSGERYLMEVKGCTLEIDGTGYFPDAPTERGVKHLRELARAVDDGYNAILLFVIQMEGVTEVRPNTDTHPEFGVALEEARAAGVRVMFLECLAGPGSLDYSPKSGII
jgi:sugar fermentation stimulation protein A